ncbi:hypothetical protein PsYK624_034420 [Phanerochaete sordida]|uniref:Uncharacterized protein n=1 Tax=Phanerochaete sordida TaxID=48140 RepID=A0A9P3G3U0_9APHY|nr:hypothetical protein PsYK624_034420 [Phanerochaete sordida]
MFVNAWNAKPADDDLLVMCPTTPPVTPPAFSVAVTNSRPHRSGAVLHTLCPRLPLQDLQVLVLHPIDDIFRTPPRWSIAASFGHAQNLRVLCVLGRLWYTVLHELSLAEDGAILFPRLEELRLLEFSRLALRQGLAAPLTSCLAARRRASPRWRLRKLVLVDSEVARWRHPMALPSGLVDDVICLDSR